jgi:vitamin B12/bleomycin/antimicrobial peptide transport system ATP-binding/permease protein
MVMESEARGKLASFGLFVRRVWALAVPYFASEEKWKARGLLAAIVALNLALVYLAVLFNDWSGRFYNALQDKNESAFWTELGNFSYLAAVHIMMVVYLFYLTQLLEIRWRKWMTEHYLRRWLSSHAFYQLELARFTRNHSTDTPDNPDQRIQEDINQFTNYTIELSMGLLKSVVTLVSFVGILWNLSGAFTFSFGGTSYTIAGFMVWMALLYCTVGSVITYYMGRRQIPMRFAQQKLEADFRHHMVRAREYSESIALERGGQSVSAQVHRRFANVVGNFLTLLRAQKGLLWFTALFGQAAVVFPFIISAPRYFSGAIPLGQLMQISSAFGKVQDALSWFIDNFSDSIGKSSLVAWRATTDRLTSFETSFQQLAPVEYAQSATKNIANTAPVHTNALALSLPDGQALLAPVTLQAHAGDRILLRGPSGSGKSTLFRALAGIWPYAQGGVHVPQEAMFVPQRPYLPNGTLRDALAYPAAASQYTDAQLQQALVDAMLPTLTEQLDVADAWSQKLSGGEQQRLAIARVLLQQPAWVFADEATSALDPATEEVLYQRLVDLVTRRGGGLVSIAHRPSLAAFHTRQWVLKAQPAHASALYALEENAA